MKDSKPPHYGRLSEVLEIVKDIESPKGAVAVLKNITAITPKIQEALDLATHYHTGQKRKGGAPYITHPICVASIVAFCGGDEAMICASLLHDVVEDTPCELQEILDKFGEDVANLVDALTKITEIRKEELAFDPENPHLLLTALTFRKILVSAIKDPRALVVKVSDRLHNMLTLDALPRNKQIRISKETIAVYAPIASRLGMSSIKNELEDKCFYYIYPHEYQSIQDYLEQSKQALFLKLNQFAGKLEKMFYEGGFSEGDFKIATRIKRPYSIYLKMQRKGAVNKDEILDLMAVRVLVKTPLECYKILGIVHLHFKPIVSRFKDHIALPKENGYQTIHTTIFDESNIYEVQIRTFDMHLGAEYGNSAHWKYKAGGVESEHLKWLHNLKYQSEESKENPQEFYELVQNDVLYREDIVVFSPSGDSYTLPAESIVLDFAYMIHSELGDKAQTAFVNNKEVKLNVKLRSGDVVKIIKGEESTPRFTLINQLRTTRAKNHLERLQKNRLKEIDIKSMVNILNTIFETPIFGTEIGPKQYAAFEKKLAEHGVEGSLSEAIKSIEGVKKLVEQIQEKVQEHPRPHHKQEQKQFGFLMKNLMQFKFGRILGLPAPHIGLKKCDLDHFIVYTNPHTQIKQVIFNDCCHPKKGDDIVAVIPSIKEHKVVVHTKVCKVGHADINVGLPMVFISWSKKDKEIYKINIYIGSTRDSLLQVLNFLNKNDCNIVKIQYASHGQYSTSCEILFEYTGKREIGEFKDMLTHKYKDRLTEFISIKDAYQD
ncbi:RelA/SpoT family protein [Helicobacter heilmannii]|uniref:GTP pyrophosphokinase, (P)ppGpp synthetase II / Guanosine-3',5'-bis(Diphosphate) 3'-pyrophosphohydrolase n=1 Tax=Helicobacter heilmannii TaxID=35817 RepID=A0A0K2XUE5_HELHE|nr:RelA/SpoT family protein [Helicobacter heilmannii]BDQ26660.1 penta-phosphate guanosine-3'-pyrophosphohydrolase [Helicobacter heilmannii]CRF46633.1 GTP pyrophosphokinase, (p)ppGpp synthetase II / Guanosine-3',5'-bis(diphosphate) 3'-pyrophosphohydrolase [Helicobacter heilmannii]CRF48430.1 GTP pyrophosphokinase, (p)ppGpp synthetase II / Guanosine-3',5'-bis(diphosphate) 3'-pyrophosphohydrolase [Helicobacter heilmannii]CRI34566.1 GTP pyrophosphokinase, (p)ppGpp synthetase II / Guanosine-3',5'-bis